MSNMRKEHKKRKDKNEAREKMGLGRSTKTAPSARETLTAGVEEEAAKTLWVDA